MTTSHHAAQDVADDLAARLATRTVALGAETDIGLRVFRGRRSVSDDLIPCVALIEGDDVVAQRGAPVMVKLAQRYVMFAYLPCDPDNPNDAAHAAIRDMKRAVFNTNGRPDDKLGGKARSVEYLGRDIGPRADGSAFVVAAIEIAVEYAENLASP